MPTTHANQSSREAATPTAGFRPGAPGDVAAPPATDSAADAPAPVDAATAPRPATVRRAAPSARLVHRIPRTKAAPRLASIGLQHGGDAMGRTNSRDTSVEGLKP